MGPVYVKLGQIASSRTDILPPMIADALTGLQADVPYEPFEVVRSVVENAFGGASIEDLYKSFDPEPFAAASIAQVHRAVVIGADGSSNHVAVKVQRPNIRESFMRELTVLRSCTDILRMTGMREVEEMVLIINDIERTINDETDFRIEMKHMRAYGRALKNERRTVVPRTISKLTRKRVLTMEYVPSRRITAYNSKDLANHIMRTHVRLVVEHGYVHCDPHPGNIGVIDDSKVVIYDFGMMARISPQKRSDLRNVCILVFNRSAEQLGELLVNSGIIILSSGAKSFGKSSFVERRSLTRIFEYIFEYLENLDTNRLVMNLMIDPDIDVNRLPFRLDENLFFLFRSMAVLEGVCKNVDPTFNYQSIITNLLFEFMDGDVIVNKVAQDLNNLRSLRTNTMSALTASNKMNKSEYPAVDMPVSPNTLPVDQFTVVAIMLYTLLLCQ